LISPLLINRGKDSHHPHFYLHHKYVGITFTILFDTVPRSSVFSYIRPLACALFPYERSSFAAKDAIFVEGSECPNHRWIEASATKTITADIIDNGVGDLEL
jgi:hypothetical protein